MWPGDGFPLTPTEWGEPLWRQRKTALGKNDDARSEVKNVEHDECGIPQVARYE
jgi:hypothetical protein